jgi:hypothetical protein
MSRPIPMPTTRLRRAVLPAILALVAPARVLASGPTPRDDGYHYELFRDGVHDARYVEWWYYDFVDPSSGLSLAFTYSILDPDNRTGLGSTELLAAAFTPDGLFHESALLPADRFHGSPANAALVVEGGGGVEVVDERTYHVTGAIAGDHEIAWDLTYVAARPPWLGAADDAVGLAPWEKMSWLVYMPAALVTGEVVIDGRSHALHAVRGYHDHNWGEWVLSDVVWNWGQYSEPGLDLEVGDFRRRPPGVVSVETRGRRTVFNKDEYRVLHTRWSYDEGTRHWFPTETRILAKNDHLALAVTIGAVGTQALLPPSEIPFLLLKPVIFEQTAWYSGRLWTRDPSGRWRLLRAFGGPGFKEYTARALAGVPGSSLTQP